MTCLRAQQWQLGCIGSDSWKMVIDDQMNALLAYFIVIVTLDIVIGLTFDVCYFAKTCFKFHSVPVLFLCMSLCDCTCALCDCFCSVAVRVGI